MTTVRINFLPRNYQPPKQMGARGWGITAAAALAVVATGAYYANAYAATVGLERQAQMDEAKHQQVKGLLAEASEIRSREDRVAVAETELKSLTGRHWSGVLLTLRELTPQNVTWTSLKVDGDNMVLTGASRGLIDVAQLFGGLVDNTAVEQVALRYVNEKGIPVTFVMKASDKEKQKSPEAVATTGVFRQLEFEMVITLAPAEGRQQPHGA